MFRHAVGPALLVGCSSCGVLMDFDAGGSGGAPASTAETAAAVTTGGGTSSSSSASGETVGSTGRGGGGVGGEGAGGEGTAGGDGLGGTGDPPTATPRWDKHIGSAGDDHLASMDVDPFDDRIAIAGRCEATLTLGPGEVIEVGDEQVAWFIAVLSGDGEVHWSRRVSLRDKAAVERDGDDAIVVAFGREQLEQIFVAGTFHEELHLTPETSPRVALGGADGFLAKVGESGSLWSKQFGGGPGTSGDGLPDDTGPQGANDLAMDTGETAFLTGRFCRDITISGCPTLSANCAGDDDLFLLSLRQFSCQGAQQVGDNFTQQGTSVAVEGTQLAVAGTFEDTLDFGAGAPLDGGDAPTSFVALLGVGEGDPPFTLQSALPLGGDGHVEVSFDGSGGVVFGGWMSPPLAMGTPSVHGGGRDVIVGRLTSTGDLVFARTLGGPEDDGGGLVRRPGRAAGLRAFGHVQGVADVGGRRVVSSDASAAFLAELDDGGVAAWVEVFDGPGDQQIDVVAYDSASREVLGGTFTEEFATDGVAFRSMGGRDIWLLGRP